MRDMKQPKLNISAPLAGNKLATTEINEHKVPAISCIIIK